MIADKIQNAHLYVNGSKMLGKAFDILKREDFTGKEVKRYEVDGDKLYYMVSKFTTLDNSESLFESHKEYIDIHYIVKGKELIGYAPIDSLTVKNPYEEKIDAALYTKPASFTGIQLAKGMFGLFYPDDGHMPGCVLHDPTEVIKVVVKLRLDAI